MSSPAFVFIDVTQFIVSKEDSQLIFTFSKSTIEIVEKV